MTVRVLSTAREDLSNGYWFYEEQEPGLGNYFLTSIYEDLDRLGPIAGVHRKISNSSHRMLVHKFPYAIYYRVNAGVAEVHAILGCHRSPDWIRKRLG